MKNKSIKYNFIMNLILTGSNFLFPLITFPYVSRMLQPEGTGKVAFAFSIISYFIILASFGVNSYGVRAIAQYRDSREVLSKVTHEILFINLLMMIFSYIIFFIFLFSSEILWQQKNLLLIVSIMMLFTILGIEWFYKGIEQYKYITVRTIILRVIALIATFIFIHSKDDYIAFAIISIFPIVCSGLINLINIKKYININLIYKYKLTEHFRPMLLLFLTAFAIAIYTNVDSTMLGVIKGNIEVGYYNSALKIKAILLSVVTSLGVVLLPRLSYYAQNGMMDKFNIILNKSVNFIILITFPIVAFFIIFGRQVILILAGNEYVESIVPLKIIMLTVIFIGMTNILGIQVLLPLKKDGALLVSVLIAAIINIVLNLFFIPTLGVVGAAISTTIAEFMVLIIQLIFIFFTLISFKKFFISIF